jgi:integrase
MENTTIDLTGVYNIKTKEMFLNKYENLNTKRAFVRVFRNTFKYEEKHNKDLYLFTKEELQEFFDHTSPSTEISARHYGRIILQYLKWAVEESIIPEHPFPVQQHYFLRYVKKEKEQFLTYKDLKYFTQFYFKNAQDGIILELLFFGVQGKEGSEICNLTIEDLNEDNHSMNLFDDRTGVRRIIYFEDNELIKFCDYAHKEDRYEKRNGEMESNPRIRPYTDLIMDTNYILKNSKTNVTHDTQATRYTLYNRLKNIQKFEQVVPVKNQITIKNIVKSGQLYMASKLYERDGELELKQLREICKHFGVKEHWSLRDYLNLDNLFRLYPHLNKENK